VLIGTRIDGIPLNANKVLTYDTVTELVSRSAAIPSDIDPGDFQWCDGVGIGTKVYGFPAHLNKVFIYDVAADLLEDLKLQTATIKGNLVETKNELNKTSGFGRI
jgi:hypothetical protein